jgi:mRNA interferase MazF
VTSSAPSPWDVVVVPFPYNERLAEKRRPALVVSSNALASEGFLWVAIITGAGKQMRAGDVAVVDLDSASLPGPSMVRTSKIATIEPARVLRIVGRLAPRERGNIARTLATFLAKAI